MLKRQMLPTSNNSRSVLLILDGQKRRRTLAQNAVKRINNEKLEFLKSDLATIK